MSATVAPPRRLRVTAFRAGLAAGVATLIAIPVLIYALVMWLDPRPPFNFEVLVDGADLSRHGAARLTIEDYYDRSGPGLIAICKGGCDSYRYREKGGDNSHTVKVLDVRGVVLAEGHDGYVSSRNAVRLKIGGKESLIVERADGVRGGSFGPFVVETPTKPPPPSTGRPTTN